jgi:hypothetical protein
MTTNSNIDNNPHTIFHNGCRLLQALPVAPAAYQLTEHAEHRYPDTIETDATNVPKLPKRHRLQRRPKITPLCRVIIRMYKISS